MALLALRPRGLNTSEQELLEFESPSAAVLVALPQRGVRSASLLVGTFLVACLIVAAVFPVSMIVVGTGTVVADDPTVVVEPLETSIIRSINVQVGQIVHAGDVLAQLDPTMPGTAMVQYQKQVDSLQAWVDRLRAEVEQKPYQPVIGTPDTILQTSLYAQRHAQFVYTVAQYNATIAADQAQAVQAAANIQGYTQRLKVWSQLEGMRSELQKLQVGSQIDLLTTIDQRIELQRDLAGSVASLDQANGQTQSQEAQRDAFVQQWFMQANQDLRDQSSNLSDARENLRQAQLRHHLVEMRAPQDGVVLTLAPVSIGSVMQSGDNFITIEPTHSPMSIVSNVDGTQSGYVRPGQPVVIKFQTFNFVRHGSAVGRVTSMSSNSFTSYSDPAQHGAVATVQGSPVSPFYRTKVAVTDVSQMHDVEGGFKLLPGMPVETDIKVGSQTIMQYLLQKVLPVPEQAFREPA